jgi:hypothetical protein
MRAGRRLVKTERLARELMERRETIPPPLLAALLITLIEEAERRKRARGLAVPVEEDEQRAVDETAD